MRFWQEVEKVPLSRIATGKLKMKLLYATSNPGKFQEVVSQLTPHHIKVYSPLDFNLKIDADETGNSLEENALLKLKTYLRFVPKNVVVMADDTGVEIEALNGEPGIHVRRWKGYRMEDEAIIQYCLERMKDVPKEKRGAQFRTVIAIGQNEGDIQFFDGILKGTITEQPIKLRMKGFPFESIFYIPEYQMMLGDLHQLSQKKKLRNYLFSHREKAIQKALPTLIRLLAV